MKFIRNILGKDEYMDFSVFVFLHQFEESQLSYPITTGEALSFSLDNYYCSK